MKQLKILLVITWIVVLAFSCDKAYLNKRPLGQLDEPALSNKKGVEKLLIGAYSLLDGIGGNKSSWFSAASNWVYGSICGSEAYTGSDDYDGARLAAVPCEKFQATGTNGPVADKWGTVYDGVQRANDVLRVMAKAKDIEPVDQKRIEGEARFLRAHYHFEAKKIWNKVPFIDQTITYANENYYVSNEKDIWQDIENDLKVAITNLPTEPYQGAVGRANKYSAMALLAKIYLFQKKYADAKPLLETIINSGRYQLVSYHENFNPATRNSAESIFSVQMSVNDGSSGMNGNYGDVLNFPFTGGPAGCCGFFCPSQYLVNHFKTNTSGLPDFDGFNNSDVTNDDGLSSTDPFTPYNGPLDPRIDWTVGRRGIPYLDWGIHPGAAWVRHPVLDGPYSPKKNVYYKSQEGQLTDASFWSNGTTTNNVNLIRFADVLLWAAEVEIEIGDLQKAREYINTVRRRAADPTGWVHTYMDAANPSLGFTNIPAANYQVAEYTDAWTDKNFAQKALRYERILELSMEGHRFFDLVRWGIAETDINSYLETEKTKRTYLNGAVFTKNKNEYFPIPQLQIDLSAGSDGKPKLKQNPGY